jgi:multidrug resistance efflux pump
VIESTEKKNRGRSVVIGILLLATLAAALTWQHYRAQAPSTANAQLVSDRLVRATFPSQVAKNIREGSRAIVTFENSPAKKLPGAVQSLEIAEPEIRVVIKLEEDPTERQRQSRCSVTVDTSVSSAEMKSD